MGGMLILIQKRRAVYYGAPFVLSCPPFRKTTSNFPFNQYCTAWHYRMPDVSCCVSVQPAIANKRWNPRAGPKQEFLAPRMGGARQDATQPAVPARRVS